MQSLAPLLLIVSGLAEICQRAAEGVALPGGVPGGAQVGGWPGPGGVPGRTWDQAGLIGGACAGIGAGGVDWLSVSGVNRRRAAGRQSHSARRDNDQHFGLS